ncbi:MAG: UxaA family hydrolase [Spirosomataceae bacterium]
MKQRVLKVHPNDNMLVALSPLKKGESIDYQGETYLVLEEIAAKHKMAAIDFSPGDSIIMYGVLVGKAQHHISKGSWIHTFNVKHAAESVSLGERKTTWTPPDVSAFQSRTFLGYHRPDGRVGTANYWIVLPLVFCENRNLAILKEALISDLGYNLSHSYKQYTQALISLYQAGDTVENVAQITFDTAKETYPSPRVFPNVDGVKFLSHDMGCGGTRQDAQALCGLLAGYITHPNVAGATVLSLGCQNAQQQMLEEEIQKRGGIQGKPIYFLEQQQLGTEEALITQAIQQTFLGLIEANKITRQPAPLSKLTIGLECGGSDGFSGISANPAIGHTSDLLVALGGSVILSEFPELCGVEQELSDRCLQATDAQRFLDLMTTYSQRATEAGSGFDMNPSPGNIKDGLITDAIKSAGAAKKGGGSPIVSVLDYPEQVTKPGLTLLCTPGNDVESTTAEVGSGATIVLFTTGLGTPTGNPIAPVLKVSSNTQLAQKMSDIIDIDTGSIIEGTESLEETGERILEYVIAVASGQKVAKAVQNQQDDFIPWKRGVSL